MANAVTTGICLYALPAREEAVLKRVISFSSTQGRDYAVAQAQAADILVVSDATVVDPAQMNPAGCVLIRIADAGTTQRHDVLMQRPLLVTKVMRTLDEAKAILSGVQAALTAAPVAAPAPTSAAPAPVSPEPEAKPAPLSLYARILGGGAVKNATQQALHKPAPELKPQAASKPTPKPAPAPAPAPQQHAVSPSEPPLCAAGNTANNNTTNAAVPGAHHLALVVDDSAAIRKQLELELRAAGIGAEFAESGEEALEKIAAKRYDLIFLDIIMPGIDGYEACRQMRLRAELKKTPIIMLSAKTSPLDEVQGVIAGASTYLTKPVKSDQLQQTLKRVSMWLDNFQVSA